MSTTRFTKLAVKNSPQGTLPTLDPIPSDALFDLKTLALPLQPKKIGTLSFSIERLGERKFQPKYDNTDAIIEIVKQRQPALLLCAGWSVPFDKSLTLIIAALKKQMSTVVLLEVCEQGTFRINDGKSLLIGTQDFSCRKDTKNPKRLRRLDAAFKRKQRSFSFLGRKANLLICGEIMVVIGRKKVCFHRHTGENTRRALTEDKAIILNPVHRWMRGRPYKIEANLEAWRKELSKDGRVYVSASNWVTPNQHPKDNVKSPLHSLWYNGKEQKPTTAPIVNEWLCYQEWCLPAL